MSAPVIILLISAAFIIVGAVLWQKGNYLLKHGKKTTAMVYTNNFSRDRDGGGTYMPVVRFLTDKDEWITHELSIGYSPALPEGTKLEVLYDPDEPTNVEINSSTQLEILPRLFVLLGVLGFIFGTLEYLEIIHVLSQAKSLNE